MGGLDSFLVSTNFVGNCCRQLPTISDSFWRLPVLLC